MVKCHTVTRGNVGKGRNGGGDSNTLHDVRLVSERLVRIANELEGADDLGREYERKVPGSYICSSSHTTPRMDTTPYCSTQDMTREGKRQAMIGPSMKLEMKKRHRTGTMGTARRQRTRDVRWSVDTHCRW